MFRTFCFSICLLLATVLPGTARAESAKVYDGDFTLLQLFTNDKDRFLREWAQPTPPKLTTTSKTVRNKPIYMMLIIAGCVGNTEGNCDVTGDVLITDPAGEVYGSYRDLPVFKGESGKLEMLRLSPITLGMTVEKGERLGPYRLSVSIKDNVAHKSLNIENIVIVDEAIGVAL